MQRIKGSFLYHCHQLRQALAAVGAEAMLPFDSFEVLARKGGEHHRFSPRFLAIKDGVRRYGDSLNNETDSFAGWMPYQRKNWLIAVDKLAFKQFSREADLQVPDYSFMPDSALKNVIIKRANGAFGTRMHGPFLRAGQYKLDMLAGEFYERFIEGSIAKIWFWNAEPICMEHDAMPSVTGNGIATIGQLISRKMARRRRLSEPEAAEILAGRQEILAFYGVDINNVLPDKQRLIIEFRYGSDFMESWDRKTIYFERQPAHVHLAELKKTGLRLQEAIPATIRKDTLFTVDAIIDKEQKLWFLEMNCNPVVHPLVYAAMAKSVVGN